VLTFRSAKCVTFVRHVQILAANKNIRRERTCRSSRRHMNFIKKTKSKKLLTKKIQVIFELLDFCPVLSHSHKQQALTTGNDTEWIVIQILLHSDSAQICVLPPTFRLSENTNESFIPVPSFHCSPPPFFFFVSSSVFLSFSSVVFFLSTKSM